MTNEYKTNILKYFTGNLNGEPNANDPTFNNIETTTNNLISTIRAYFSSMVIYTGFIPSKNNKNQNMEYSVLACWGTLISKNADNGMIVILDKEYNIVQILTEYSDGTNIGLIQCMSIDDNGNYYLVEKAGNNLRIVLLNNLVLKPIGSNNYEAIQIETHNIPNQYTWEKALKVIKNDAGNKYFVAINRDNADGLVGCELTTGDSDTWKYYLTDLQKASAFSMLDNGYNVYWTSDGELNFQIAVDDGGLIMLSKGNTLTMVKKRLTNDVVSNASNFVFYSNRYGYYASMYDNDASTKTYFNIFKVDLENNSLNPIYSKEVDFTVYPWLWFFKNNNSIYFYRAEKGTSSTNFNLYFGLIDDSKVYETEVGDYTASTFYNSFCYPNVITDFNKKYIYIQNQDTLFTLDFIWNENDYNGASYNGLNSLIPNKMAILDENNVEIFNRNIYNLSTYSNWYTASMEIPNYYLNNDTLSQVNLYSKANNLMTNNSINLTKNIYEQLNINVINKFRIFNEDEEELESAIGFTNGMMAKDTSKSMRKIKVQYNAGTYTSLISRDDITYNDNQCEISFLIYTPSSIPLNYKRIELVSEDETIIYKTINIEDLLKDTFYRISFNVSVE